MERDWIELCMFFLDKCLIFVLVKSAVCGFMESNYCWASGVLRVSLKIVEFNEKLTSKTKNCWNDLFYEMIGFTKKMRQIFFSQIILLKWEYLQLFGWCFFCFAWVESFASFWVNSPLILLLNSINEWVFLWRKIMCKSCFN